MSKKAHPSIEILSHVDDDSYPSTGCVGSEYFSTQHYFAMSLDSVDFLLLFLVTLHLILAPYSKVEESFNLQAIHDVFVHGITPNALQFYDHLDYPGVVPRTFLGPLVIGQIMKPLYLFHGKISSIYFQYLARGILGSFNVISLLILRRAVSRTFGTLSGTCFLILCCCQFHIIFWASRTLPNMFALPFVTLAISAWVRSRGIDAITPDSQRKYVNICISLLIFSGTIFRFELGGILLPIFLLEYFRGTMSITNLLMQTITVFIPSAGITILIDSYFWRQSFLWPELMVFYFNGIQGKSVEYGISPWHTYFTTHLPKLLMISLPLAIFTIFKNRQARILSIPSLIFVSAFSALGHKEWRFIVYVVPVFNMIAGIGMGYILRRSQRSFLYGIAAVGVIVGILACFAASTGMMMISRLNYPGGDALQRLHQLEKCNDTIIVHIDPYTAMTGASLFGQECNSWIYSKNESLGTDSKVYAKHFTHLLTHEPKNFTEYFGMMDIVQAYDGIQIDFERLQNNTNLNEMFPIGARMTDSVWILKKKSI